MYIAFRVYTVSIAFVYCITCPHKSKKSGNSGYFRQQKGWVTWIYYFQLTFNTFLLAVWIHRERLVKYQSNLLKELEIVRKHNLDLKYFSFCNVKNVRIHVSVLKHTNDSIV